jgi:type II secretory pathway component GspD/PulD (secretin)
MTLLHSISFAAETMTEVITLFNRPASEILPLLNPLLEDTDRVIADGSNLIVKSAPERLGEIILLIDKLDAPINNLLITVMHSRHVTARELNAATRLSRNGRLKPGAGITGHHYQTNDQDSSESTQTIRIMEGKTAYIAVGKSYPTENIQTYNSGYFFPNVFPTTEYIDTTTSFEVTPRLIGQNPSSDKQQVILDVSPAASQLNTRGEIQNQNLQTTIKINLGEWVELGESDQNNNIIQNATIRRTNKSKSHTLIKVEKANM